MMVQSVIDQKQLHKKQVKGHPYIQLTIYDQGNLGSTHSTSLTHSPFIREIHTIKKQSNITPSQPTNHPSKIKTKQIILKVPNSTFSMRLLIFYLVNPSIIYQQLINMNKSYLLIVALLVAAAVVYQQESTTSEVSMTEYLNYLQQYGKTIPHGEELIYRSKIYAKNIETINKHNSDSSKSWKMGINHFADITQEQFISLYLGEKPIEVKELNQPVNVGFQGEIDWRNKNVVTKVKNQGSCGSCWAFAATAAHESYQIQFKNQPGTIDLSEQQLVDCAGISPYENNGCNGGYAVRALEYIKDFGQATQVQYPYTAKTGDSCLQQTGKYRPFGVAEGHGCEQIQYMMARRPLAVRVDASNWHLYKSGIFDNCNKNINHAVFLVGTSQTAWTIKNSWTATWGENGYIRLAKGDTCAMCQGPSFAI